METEKAKISKVFAELRKYNFLVYNFNQKDRFGRGLIGFVDHLIIGRNCVWFVEVKIGKDKLSKEQTLLADRIEYLERYYGSVDYRIITSPNELQIAHNIKRLILERG